MKGQWFNFRNEGDVVEIRISGLIISDSFPDDPGVSGKAFVDALTALPATVRTIRLFINSPGGDVQGALGIANALADERRAGRAVDVIVDGIAASAATIPMMAGSSIRIADNGLVMIHNPESLAYGDAGVMRKAGDMLDAIRGTIVATYKWHSPLSEDEIATMMDAETWMDADEAIANGFATEKIEGLQATARIDARVLAHLKAPAKFQARLNEFVSPAAPGPAAAADVLALCRKHKCMNLAEDFVTNGATLEHVRARTETASTIRAICSVNHLEGFADGYIRASVAIDVVKEHMLLLKALIDNKQIDGSLLPGGPAAALISSADIYAKRNAPSAEAAR